MMERLITVIQDVRAIKEALLGNELRPDGALDRLNKLEQQLAHMEKLIDRAKYVALVLVLSIFQDLYEVFQTVIRLW